MNNIQGILGTFVTHRRRHASLQKAAKIVWVSLCLAFIVAPVTPAFAVATVTTTTTLTSGTNPVAVGSTTLLTASVTGTAPTGTVTFKSGTTTLGTGALSGSGNTRTATFLATFTTTGAKSLTAVYGGDATNITSTSTAVSETVSKAASSTTVSSSLNPSTSGASVTFTATVVGFTPAGTVTFKDGTTTLGTGTLSGTGNTRTTTYTTSALSVASHNITAVYAGNTLNTASTSAAMAQVVGLATTAVTLSTSVNPANFGQSMIWTASLTGQVDNGGTFNFMEGATTLVSSSLGAGTVSLDISTFTTLSVGSHNITVVYSGDAANAASTSPAMVQVVIPATTTTTLTSSANPVNLGQSLTLTATVTGQTPGGTVTFKDGATTLGSGTLNAGVASLAISTLSAASHNLTAVYGGDVNNATSTSSALVQGVNLATTSTALSATPNPVTAGQNVTLTASISGNSPTGTVTFMDGSTTLGTGSVSGGTATFSLSSPGQGSHSITAAYSGDTYNLASNSNAMSLNVGMNWQYGYDAMGRLSTIVDPNGLASYIYYDSLGRPIQTQQPPNTGSATPTVIGMSYNLADGLTSVADPRNLTTTYNPNGLGQVTTQSSPDTGSSQFSYDIAGNLLTSVDARGKQTQYSYDSLDRVTSITYPTGSSTAFEYDGGATPTPAENGELTKITDESGQTSYSHDALGRLTTKTTVISGKTFTTSYSWGDSGSALDKLIAISYPSGTKVNYSYDAQGALNAVSVAAVNPNGVGTGSGTSLLLSTITYNADNKITGWLWADGKARPIGYDTIGQVASYSLGDPMGVGTAAGTLRRLSRDSAGRITGYSHFNNAASVPNLDQGFGYDNLNRLLTTSVGGTSTLYSYDASGNRTSKTVDASSYSNTVDTNSNRLLQIQDVGGTVNVLYDAAGHITSDGVNSYAYSDRGRMISATTAGGTVAYLYNGLGQRVYKSGPSALVSTGAAYYLYDELGQLLGEYDSAGNPLYETIYLGSLPVGVMKQTGSAATGDIAVNLYNLHADHIATPRVITRQADQAIVWRWDTAEAFGGTAPEQDPSGLGTFTFNQRFPGQVFDAETGLFQNWNREYNARQGRYIQSDPIGLRGGINTFAYVEGNPLSYSDPEGLLFMSTIGGVQRGTTLDQAATYGAAGNAALATGIGGAVGSAAAASAGAAYMMCIPAPARTAIGLLKGLRDDAIPAPTPPQPPVLTPPAIVRPGGSTPPPFPPGFPSRL